VHSPTLSGTTQADAYRPLFLPTVLIGDSRLGGISSTISAYESLLLRGYIVDAILLFQDEYYRNFEYLTPFFAERSNPVPVFSIPPPPPKLANASENFSSTDAYYSSIVPPSKDGPIFDVLRNLDSAHTKRISELDSMAQRTLDTIWWPFVQHGLFKERKDVTVIDSAYSDFFTTYGSSSPSSSDASRSLLSPQFDGSASWWTQALGHAHPSLAMAAARAAGRYGHVMFPVATHEPALKLAERLVHDGPGKGWASRAYFSDDGSTGMEIALKMAMRTFTKRYGAPLDAKAKKNLGILGLKGSYHGDTIGAMDACEEGIYTCEWHNAKGYWFDSPTISIKNGKTVITLPPPLSDASTAVDVEVDSLASAYDVPSRLSTPLAEQYRSFITRTLESLTSTLPAPLAALVLEPLVLGAGGMLFVDPLFQRILVDVVRSLPTPLPVIFDEVFVGLYRIGFESTSPLLGVQPDISVHAKILTGGLVPLAITLANSEVFNAFLGEKKEDALLHGHSYTAHAIGCEVANEMLDLISKMTSSEAWNEARENWIVASEGSDGQKENRDSQTPSGVSVWSFWDSGFVKALSSLENVSEVMTLGTVIAIKLRDQDAGLLLPSPPVILRITNDRWFYLNTGYASRSAEKVLQSIKTVLHDDNVLSSAPGGAQFGIHFRTLGNVAYFMTSLNTSSKTIREVEDRVWGVLHKASSSASP
jgi:bifunctional dethiobiotin synthetase / adenosylmethionine---8-amino-7-oxononanoate aminotransferase